MNKSNIKNKILKTELVNWQELSFLQNNNFKELKKDDWQKLRNSIIKNNFVQVFNVWQDGEKLYCLDGYHRIKVLNELKKEGYNIPEKLPANFIDCKDKKEASKLVLTYSSVYAKITDDGLYEFISNNELDFDDLKIDVNIPEIDLDYFEKGYFDKEKTKEIEEQLKPFSKTHILISFPSEKLIEIEPFLKEILKISGIEYEQSSN